MIAHFLAVLTGFALATAIDRVAGAAVLAGNRGGPAIVFREEAAVLEQDLCPA